MRYFSFQRSAAMTRRWLVVLSGLMFSLSGCLYNTRERADETVCSLAMQPYDQQPAKPLETKSGGSTPSSMEKKSEAPSLPPLDAQTTALTTPAANATPLASEDTHPPE